MDLDDGLARRPGIVTKPLRPGGPLQRMADDLGAAPSQLALARLLQRSSLMLPIPGTSTVAHLEENVDAALIKLTGDQVRQLDAAP